MLLLHVYLVALKVYEPVREEREILVGKQIDSESVSELPSHLDGEQTLCKLCVNVRVYEKGGVAHLHLVLKAAYLILQLIGEQD